MHATGTSPAVLMKAYVMAYEAIGLTPPEAANLLGVSEDALAQSLYVGFAENSSEADIQLALVRMYHLLFALSDGDSRRIGQWLNQFNFHLNAVPLAICHNLAGIIYLTDYLEDMHSGEGMPSVDIKGHIHAASDDEENMLRR